MAVCLLVVAAVGALTMGAATVAATAPSAADGTLTHTPIASTDAGSPATATPRACEDDGYDPPAVADDWSVTTTDDLSTESLDRWTGGRIAPVGADGDCSLFVAAGDSAALSDATVDASRGIVVGTLDLGEHGSLRLVDAGSGATTEPTTRTESATDESLASATAPPAATATAPAPTATEGSATDRAATTVAEAEAETATETVAETETATATAEGPTLAIENRGPDFSTAAVVSVGDRSRNLTLPSGRFFEFAVARSTDGTVCVAIWEYGRLPADECDATFDSVAETEWRVQVDGRAFLDSLAIGERAAPSADGPSGGGPDAATPTPTEDPFPNMPDMPDEDDPGSEFEGSDRDEPADSAFAGTVIGLIVVAIGGAIVRFAYGISRFGEQLDAIGSTTPPSEVEPADWNVALTKLGGVLVALYGVYMIVSSFL